MLELEKDVYYAILSGKHATLPLAELKAILDVEAEEYKILYVFEGLVLFEAKLREPQIITERSGWIKEIGKALYLVDADENQLREILSLISRDKHVKIEVRHFKRYGSYIDKGSLKKIEFKPNRLSQTKIRVFFTEGIALIGVIISVLNTRALYYRKPGKRPFFKPGPLDPNLTRSMINLSRLKRGDLFLDPFCGTGGFVIEACYIGASKCICGDILYDMVRGSMINVNYYKLENKCLVVSHNATSLPLRENSIGAIATDPPYGRSTTTKKKLYSDLVEGFLQEAVRVLRKGAYLVFAGPLQEAPSDIARRVGLKVLERHHMHVHSTLVREIVVARV